MKNAPFGEFGRIYFRTPTVGFVMGDHGNIYRTSDDGATWQSQVLTGDHGISAVNFLNDTLGFCVANDASPGEGQVFMTKDGGLTWRDDSLRSRITGLSGIIFPDSNNVLVLSQQGFFRRHLNMQILMNVVDYKGSNIIQSLSLSTFPNPATNTTTLDYDFPKASPIEITIYNVTGKRMQEIQHPQEESGHHEEALDLSGYADGTYFISVSACGMTERVMVQVVR